MTQEQIEEAVTRAAERAIDNKLGQFYIDRETHWEDHKFITDLRKMFDLSKAEMCKGVVKWGLTIVIGLIMLGWAVTKGWFARL